MLIRTGPSNNAIGARADLTKACTCKPRHPLAYMDDTGADFDCPHHGWEAIKDGYANVEFPAGIVKMSLEELLKLVPYPADRQSK